MGHKNKFTRVDEKRGVEEMIGVKYIKPQAVFEVLLDSEPSSDMTACRDETEAERTLYQEYMRAVYEIRNQYHQAVDKIRGIK